MANPFFIEPANPLQALMMGVQGYDRSQKLGREQQLTQARREAGQALASGGDTRGALARLIGAGDPTSATAIAQLGKADNTDDIKEYKLAQQQGFKGSFFDFQTSLKRAGANQNTINMPPMEKAYDQAVGKEFAEQNIGIIKGSQEAQRKIGTLDRLGQLINDPNTYTGAGAEAILQAKRYAKALGVDVGNVSGPEAIKSISNQFALELRNPAGGAGMPGAMSDKDREFLQASVPGLTQTKEGNAQIIDFMKRVANRAVQVEKLRQDYVRQNGRLNEGFYQVLRQNAETKPLFPEAAQPPAPSVTRPQVAPARQDIEAEMRRRGLLR